MRRCNTHAPRGRLSTAMPAGSWILEPYFNRGGPYGKAGPLRRVGVRPANMHRTVPRDSSYRTPPPALSLQARRFHGSHCVGVGEESFCLGAGGVFDRVAQRPEHRAHIPVVGGSNPSPICPTREVLCGDGPDPARAGYERARVCILLTWVYAMGSRSSGSGRAGEALPDSATPMNGIQAKRGVRTRGKAGLPAHRLMFARTPFLTRGGIPGGSGIATALNCSPRAAVVAGPGFPTIRHGGTHEGRRD